MRTLGMVLWSGQTGQFLKVYDVFAAIQAYRHPTGRYTSRHCLCAEPNAPHDAIQVRFLQKCGSRNGQDVSHLHAIGSIAYAKIPKEVNPSKLDTVSVKYTLIGYYGHDAYKLLDQATGDIIKAHNVVFEEGTGHRTLFQQDALRDEPIFDGELDEEPNHPVTKSGTPTVENTTPAPNTPEQIPNIGRVVTQPYPIAPRHRAAHNLTANRQTQTDAQEVALNESCASNCCPPVAAVVIHETLVVAKVSSYIHSGSCPSSWATSQQPTFGPRQRYEPATLLAITQCHCCHHLASV